jgi:outer membrane protein assembly factor BamE (lipoprotein component of BamABCDE complex)
MLERTAVAAALLVSVFVIGACAPTVDSTGHQVRPEALAQLKPGVLTRDDVRRLLGSPSSVAPFEPNVWYYIGEKQETVAFFNPTVLERHVLIVNFDENGVLQSVGNLDVADGAPITPVSRETPTKGQELTIMEQLLGNLGRFNTPQGSGPFKRGGF